MKRLEIEELAHQYALLGKTMPKEEAEPTASAPAPVTSANQPAQTATPVGVKPAASGESSQITIDDFIKVDMRVGIVLDAAPVKGADKLLHLHVDIGEPQPRSIVAGIAMAYKPEQLVGRKVVIVANLAPRKLRGLESQGMILAASLEGGSPALASFLEDVPPGARLK